jgi:hypothetical protein
MSNALRSWYFLGKSSGEGGGIRRNVSNTVSKATMSPLRPGWCDQ